MRYPRPLFLLLSVAVKKKSKSQLLKNRVLKVGTMSEVSIPISTRWLLDAVGDIGRSAIDSVYMIVCPETRQKGTGFLLKSGYVMTNWHIVEGSTIDSIRAISSKGVEVNFHNLIVDRNRDLVALLPDEKIEGGLDISDEEGISVGTQVSTWGYPLGYNGPAPLLTMGYLSGFNEVTPKGPIVKHLVVNGAFNPGNSGGPLFVAGQDEVVGVVVSKHTPIPRTLASALQALANNPSGMQYVGRDAQGNDRRFLEAQIVADLLYYFRRLIQVVIGEAIAGSEVIAFLTENDISS